MGKGQTEVSETEETQEPASAKGWESKAGVEEDPKGASAEGSEAEEDEEPAQEAKEALEGCCQNSRLEKAEVGRFGWWRRLRVCAAGGVLIRSVGDCGVSLPEGELGSCEWHLAFGGRGRGVHRHTAQESDRVKGGCDVLKVVGRGDADVQRVLEEVRPGTGRRRANDLERPIGGERIGACF